MLRNVSDYLGRKYVVTGMIKLGAGALDIFNPTKSVYRHLTRKDVIMVQEDLLMSLETTQSFNSDYKFL
jgi:hypothetical protein